MAGTLLERKLIYLDETVLAADKFFISTIAFPGINPLQKYVGDTLIKGTHGM